MILIIGGAFQGKKEYALKNYDISSNEMTSGETMSLTDFSDIKCIYNFQILIKRLIENRISAIDITNSILEQNPAIVIIINEIGNGIIPLEKSERVWREQVGKVGCALAEKADEVVRITCGCALKLKGN